MEHAMFRVPLFADRDRYRLRVQYFVKAVKHLLNNVGIAFHTRKESHSCLFFQPPQSTHEGTAESTDLQGQGVNEVAGVVAGVVEGGEVASETPEGNGGVEETAEVQNEWMEGTGLQDLTIEVAPQSPASSLSFSDAVYPPSPDAGIETTNVDDPVAGGDEGTHLAIFSITGTNQSCGFTKQPKKRGKGSDDEDGEECEPV
jgi:hypothetical protein